MLSSSRMCRCNETLRSFGEQEDEGGSKLDPLRARLETPENRQLLDAIAALEQANLTQNHGRQCAGATERVDRERVGRSFQVGDVVTVHNFSSQSTIAAVPGIIVSKAEQTDQLRVAVEGIQEMVLVQPADLSLGMLEGVLCIPRLQGTNAMPERIMALATVITVVPSGYCCRYKDGQEVTVGEAWPAELGRRMLTAMEKADGVIETLADTRRSGSDLRPLLPQIDDALQAVAISKAMWKDAAVRGQLTIMEMELERWAGDINIAAGNVATGVECFRKGMALWEKKDGQNRFFEAGMAHLAHVLSLLSAGLYSTLARYSAFREPHETEEYLLQRLSEARIPAQRCGHQETEFFVAHLFATAAAGMSDTLSEQSLREVTASLETDLRRLDAIMSRAAEAAASYLELRMQMQFTVATLRSSLGEREPALEILRRLWAERQQLATGPYSNSVHQQLCLLRSMLQHLHHLACSRSRPPDSPDKVVEQLSSAEAEEATAITQHILRLLPPNAASTCPICLEDIPRAPAPWRVWFPPCSGHAVHWECGTDWSVSAGHARCPVCRDATIS